MPQPSGPDSRLWAIYNGLKKDAPEAAVGVAAAAIMIALVTASRLFSSWAEALLLCIAGLYGIIGASAFVVTIYRIYKGRP